MPSCAVLSIAFALVAVTRALPVDDTSVRNGIGGQVAEGSVSAATSSCKTPLTECASSEGLETLLLKLGPENAGKGGGAAPNAKALLNLIGGTNSTSQVPVGRLSGTGGEAPKVSAIEGSPALIDLNSNSAGQRGDASNRNSSGLAK